MHDIPVSAAAETIEVHERVVACDGSGDPLGHPRIYLRIVDGEITCPYCSRRYLLAAGAAPGSAH